MVKVAVVEVGVSPETLLRRRRLEDDDVEVDGNPPFPELELRRVMRSPLPVVVRL